MMENALKTMKNTGPKPHEDADLLPRAPKALHRTCEVREVTVQAVVREDHLQRKRGRLSLIRGPIDIFTDLLHVFYLKKKSN